MRFMKMSNQLNNSDSFIVSDVLADRLSHWAEESNESGTTINELDNNTHLEQIAETNNIIVKYLETAYVYPLLGWDSRKNRIDLEVPGDHLWMFTKVESLEVVFFEKEINPIHASGQFLDNLWRISVYYDDI